MRKYFFLPLMLALPLVLASCGKGLDSGIQGVAYRLWNFAVIRSDDLKGNFFRGIADPYSAWLDQAAITEADGIGEKLKWIDLYYSGGSWAIAIAYGSQDASIRDSITAYSKKYLNQKESDYRLEDAGYTVMYFFNEWELPKESGDRNAEAAKTPDVTMERLYGAMSRDGNGVFWYGYDAPTGKEIPGTWPKSTFDLLARFRTSVSAGYWSGTRVPPETKRLLWAKSDYYSKAEDNSVKQYFDPDLFGGRARNGYGIAYSKNAIEYRWYYPGESVKEADVAEFLKKCYLNRQDEKNMAVPVDNQDLFRESGVREVQCATGYDKEADATIFRNRIVFLNDFSPQKAIESDTAKPAKAGK